MANFRWTILVLQIFAVLLPNNIQVRSQRGRIRWRRPIWRTGPTRAVGSANCPHGYASVPVCVAEEYDDMSEGGEYEPYSNQVGKDLYSTSNVRTGLPRSSISGRKLFQSSDVGSNFYRSSIGGRSLHRSFDVERPGWDSDEDSEEGKGSASSIGHHSPPPGTRYSPSTHTYTPTYTGTGVGK